MAKRPLSSYTLEELKAELKRRKLYESAKKHIDSAERRLLAARDKAEQYRKVIKEEES